MAQLKVVVNKVADVGTMKLSTKPKGRANTMTKSMEVNKQIIQLRAKLDADIKAKLKAAGLVVFDEPWWNQPNEYDFKRGIDAKKYLAERRVQIDGYTIRTIVNDPTAFGFATLEEVNDFKTKVWPKLKAKYEAKRAAIRKAERAENAKDISKLKAKIAKLQAQLEELEG